MFFRDNLPTRIAFAVINFGWGMAESFNPFRQGIDNKRPVDRIIRNPMKRHRRLHPLPQDWAAATSSAYPDINVSHVTNAVLEMTKLPTVEDTTVASTIGQLYVFLAEEEEREPSFPEELPLDQCPKDEWTASDQ